MVGGRFRRRLGAPSAVMVMVAMFGAVLAGCGGGGPDSDTGAAPSAAAPEVSYPLTVPTCNGRMITIAQEPQRIVALHQNQLETLIDLGLRDRVVGWVQFGPYEPAARYRDAVATVTKLGSGEVAAEVLVAAQPDLVVSNDPLEAVNALDIPVYEAALYCQQGSGGADAVVDAVVTDVQTIGQLTNRQAQAAEAISDFQSRIEAVEHAVAGKPRPSAVSMYYFGPVDGQPSIYANQSPVGTAIEVAGGTQAFAEVAKVFGRVSREEIIARAPDYLVIIDNDTHSADEVMTYLKGNPDFQRVPAVQNNHLVSVPFDAALPGLRYAETAEQLAEAFHGVTIGP